MLNYEADPAILAPLVPAGTTLDLWDGRALISVVGFRFLDTRLLGLPVPGHRNFEEVNLRFYVRREIPGGASRRAVVFVREIVPRRAIALVARLAYNEPYIALPMRSLVPATLVARPGRIEYGWRIDGRWSSVAATTDGEPALAHPDDEATFITEHYWGYTRQRDGGTVEYEVTHPRWRIWPAHDARLDADVAALYGERFSTALGAQPRSAFVAEGSAIEVHLPGRLTGVA
jgi:uncharacterized protein YqjF (DUF2071 family)